MFHINFAFKQIHFQVDGTAEDSLNIENTAWSNTVVATGTITGAVVYTGRETRSVMNTSKGTMKVGPQLNIADLFETDRLNDVYIMMS